MRCNSNPHFRVLCFIIFNVLFAPFQVSSKTKNISNGPEPGVFWQAKPAIDDFQSKLKTHSLTKVST